MQRALTCRVSVQEAAFCFFSRISSYNIQLMTSLLSVIVGSSFYIKIFFLDISFSSSPYAQQHPTGQEQSHGPGMSISKRAINVFPRSAA